ncbi:MAG TPA: PAS domain-containing protein [Nitrospira sp.]|nr:PAS domain-containing protein [Nitrospira sp.]
MLTTPMSSSTQDQGSYAYPQRGSAAGQTQPHYQDLARLLEAIVWRADATTLEITYVSEQAKRILGYPLSQWRQPDFQETHLHPEDRLKVLACYREAIRDGENHRLDYRMRAADGREVWFHDCVHAINVGARKELIGVMVDITDRKSAEACLTEMTGRLIRAQEEERSRIARELHDDFNQRLALLAIGLQRLGHTFESETGVAAQVSDLYHMTQEIASDVHRLSHQLHPAKLQHLGLVPAIKGLCRELSEQYGAEIDFVHRNVPNPIAQESALCIFRVAQEALSNTVKHSGVKQGKLELFSNRGILHLCVSDSGTGFDPEAISAKGRLGLTSMQERVRAAGGTISVESRPSTGTRISVHLAA